MLRRSSASSSSSVTTLLLVGAAALLALLCTAALADLSALSDMQQTDGGFATSEQSSSSADGTYKALYLAAFLGQKHLIDVEGAVSFLYSLKNEDGGFGQQKGFESDVYSTRDAVLGVLYSGASSFPNAAGVLQFLQSRFDERTGMFAADAKKGADLVATAAAIRTYEALDALENDVAKASLKSIRSQLQQGPDGLFNVDDSLPRLESNYYGVYLANKAGVYIDKAKMMLMIRASQLSNGGFDIGAPRADSIPSGSAFAMLAASVVDAELELDPKKTRGFALQHANTLPNLEDKYSATVVLANSGNLEEFYQDNLLTIFQSVSGPVREERVVIGTQVRIAARVHIGSQFDSTFEVDLLIQLPGQSEEEATVDRLQWNDDAMGYLSANTQSLDKFGKYVFTFRAKKNVYGVGDITVRKSETKTVGYRLVLDPQVFTDGVAVKREGGEVAANTKFSFGLVIEDADGPAKSFPPTTVEFLALDPSGVQLAYASQNLDTENSRVDPFDFTIPEPAIPGGFLTFSFRLSTEGVEGVHSERSTRYFLPNTLQASNIQFVGVADESPSFKVGDKVSISINPVIVDEHGETTPLAKRVGEVDVFCARKYSINLATPSGEVFQTVDSECADDFEQGDRYTFNFEVKPTFEYVAQPVITFNFVPHQGAAVEIARGENAYVEEGQLFRLNVNAHPYVKDVKKSVQSSSLEFGDDVDFEFSVEDSVSGQRIQASEKAAANVYAELRHIPGEQKKPVSCGREIATQNEDGSLIIDWLVNANAIRGPSEISLAIFAGEERLRDLYRNAGSDEPYAVRVTIRGDVQVESNVFDSPDNIGERSAFTVEFKLRSGERVLKDASFRCDITRSGWSGAEVIATDVPVAVGDGNTYQVSFSALHKTLPSGEYKLSFFRADGLDQRDEKDQPVPSFTISLHHSGLSTFTGAANLSTKLLPLFAALFYLVRRYLAPKASPRSS